ncbi:MAG: class I SAM-dependent methyltransferase, partial [Ilumatobacteraceae bacterium]
FGAAYYRRFYGRRPVHNRWQIGHLVEGVLSLASWWRIPIRSVLDIGAGKGYWRDWLAETHPNVKYHGIDASEYACNRFGHELADIAEWQPPRQYDLVVCQSVLQYVNAKDATKAIDTLAAACRGLLVFDAPTIADRDNVIDPSHTDLDVNWRTGNWYRKRLTVGFMEIGAGIWLSRQCPAAFFELERAR